VWHKQAHTTDTTPTDTVVDSIVVRLTTQSPNTQSAYLPVHYTGIQQTHGTVTGVGESG
jgi:hypothetical protein